MGFSPKLVRLHANHSYTDDTQAPFMQPAPRGATHDKLTSKDALCNGMCAFATRFPLCLSPASNGSQATVQLFQNGSCLQLLRLGHWSAAFGRSSQLVSSAPASSAAASSSLR